MLADHGVDGIADFEQRLRSVYPQATVHPRLLSGEPRLIWYVYRDGRWVNARGGEHNDDRSERGPALDGGIDP
jgi:hypothetical protein